VIEVVENCGDKNKFELVVVTGSVMVVLIRLRCSQIEDMEEVVSRVTAVERMAVSIAMACAMEIVVGKSDNCEEFRQTET
jgi:hypothetical protein